MAKKLKVNKKDRKQYTTGEIINSTTNEFIFGKDFPRKVRECLGFYDTLFMPDLIITAPLHTDLVKDYMSEFLWRAQTSRVKLTEPLQEGMRSIARDYLIASVCHALNSRKNGNGFEEYKETDWLGTSNLYRKTANERYDKLLKENGGLYMA